ncbi:MAG: glycosyltransferase [Candidatus Omnitrophica bacterium]|nr:glycosyltransferase [Candidatus Omnitrophota bacterium]
MRSHILVLNYNGQQLLAECLPSIVAAAGEAAGCRVSVVDNDSRDGSVEWLRATWPQLGVFRQPNRGLVSLNPVAAQLDEPIVFLLNNDVKLASGFVNPMLDPFRQHPDCFAAAPLCWGFDGQTYEGMLTRVRWRRGLVQAGARYPGHERLIHRPGWTAAAGPVLAVDRRKFLALGGYDSLYLPGRLEDLDLCYRGWVAGWKARYVPQAVAYHKGFASFHEAFGVDGCDRLALRNTLLFVWKNLRDGRCLAAHGVMVAARATHSLLAAAWTPRARRWLFLRALYEALTRLPAAHAQRKALGRQLSGRGARPTGTRRQLLLAERAFFSRFQW